MPPRRAGRVSSSSRLFDNSSEAGGPLGNVHTNVGRGMSPGPAKYSSTYGSPPTVVPARQNVARQRYNLTSALNHVVDAVEQDNVNDARERAEREAELQRRTADGENSRQGRVAVARGDEENDKEQEEEGEGEAGAHERRDETLESVELVTTPGANEEPRPEPPKQDSRPREFA
ncbi:spindle pole body-associated protein sad1 [Niveomyces insectorum RCEF 264]|uniref:Spindle pole body-associated protein sad1 n=1 Tax=Niveomyces insectorum RCEF 264 TaxID=1081102 RepID=A0A167YWH4_9HYPO|nr:spindle pole body-associated protein sad1 [Niveomyces insectorum RCEF 264]